MSSERDSRLRAKAAELWAELRTVLAGRRLLLDSILPVIVFVILNGVWGRSYALWGGLALALSLALFRFSRGQSVRYALGGVGAVLLAGLMARLLNSDVAAYLPTLVISSLTVLLCGISLIARRPLVAWSSYLTRRWPPEWYWHPRVRPAYSEVTFGWLLFFLLRLLPQIFLLSMDRATLLGFFQLIAGWPATILLLIVSYLYGSWRLRQLAGPSVDEFKAGVAPPWQGQQRGF